MKYTIEKFNEIKEKEMQLIQMGEDKVRSEINLTDGKLKKKIEQQKEKIKKLELEGNDMKLKLSKSNQQRSYRLDLEKA